MVVLAAINAKYIHSNLAVYNLKAYAEKKLANMADEALKSHRDSAGFKKVEGTGSREIIATVKQEAESEKTEIREIETKKATDIKIAEYTINQPFEAILGSLFEMQAETVAFSCYIWNVEYVCRLATELKKIMPEVQIWAGGPEVSYHPQEFMEQYPCFDILILGEGEETFSRLVQGDAREQINGIAYRSEQQIRIQPLTELVDLNTIPFVYKDMKMFQHRIVYYESSRGCPFRCSYCLSSIDKQVRFRNWKLVQEELQFFLDHQVPQVKFIDRTFNCNSKHAMAIWNYILEHDNGITNFHFEISADLLTEQELDLLKQMRKGLVQFEIGLQSTNADTIQAIERHMDIDKIYKNMKKIQNFANIHQHLDLIAGLPFEDLQRFRQSFDEAYAMGAEQLQLGFLKVLKGSKMEERVAEYDLQYMDEPPYEVLATKWLSYGNIRTLKRVEEMLEVYHNSGQFKHSLAYLMSFQNSAFDFFLQLGEYYKQKGYEGLQWKRLDRYTILRDFARNMYARNPAWDSEKLDRLLLHDLYLRENLKKRPEWAGQYEHLKKDMARFFRNSGNSGKCMHLEPWNEDNRTGYMLYDYEGKSEFDASAAVRFVSEEEFRNDAKGTGSPDCRDFE